MAGIDLVDGFNVTVAKPLDYRYLVATLAARDAIPSGVRFPGMQVYVEETPDVFYFLSGGIDNANWTEAGSGSGAGGLVVADVAAMWAIPDDERFDGLKVYVIDGSRNFQFRGGIEDTDIVEEIVFTNLDDYLAATLEFTGTNGDIPGAKGLVPAPQNSDVGKVLSAEGSWRSTKESLDEVFALRAFEDVDTQWSTNVPIRGTLTKETVDPLSGQASYKFVVGTFGGIRYSPVVPVEKRFRGNTATLYFPYTYDGNNTTLKIHLIGNPTGTPIELIPDDVFLQGSNGGNAVYKINVRIPNNVTDICFAVETFATDVGKIFNFGDIRLTTDRTIYANIANITEWIPFTPTGSWTTNTTYSGRWRRVGDTMEINYFLFFTGVPSAGQLTLQVPSGYNIDTSKMGGATRYPAGVGEANSGVVAFFQLAVTNSTTMEAIYAGAGGVQTGVSNTQPVSLGNTHSFNIVAKVPIVGWTAQSPTIVLANETFDSATANLTYAGSSQYNLSTLPNAPVGTILTFTGASNSTQAVTQTNAAPPTQSMSQMNSQGLNIFAKPYGSASNSNQPATFAIQIGKWMKSVELTFNSGASGSGEPLSIDKSLGTSAIQRTVGLDKAYTPETGVLFITAARNIDSNSNRLFESITSNNTFTNGYLTINASKSPALSGVPMPKRYIVATYESGTDQGWYEVYNDGWVVQGHTQNVGTGAALKTVTPLISLRTGTKPRYFSFMTAGNGVAGTAEANQVYSEGNTTATSFAFYNNVTPSLPFIIWEAKGYGDSAAVKALGAKPNY